MISLHVGQLWQIFCGYPLAYWTTGASRGHRRIHLLVIAARTAAAHGRRWTALGDPSAHWYYCWQPCCCCQSSLAAADVPPPAAAASNVIDPLREMARWESNHYIYQFYWEMIGLKPWWSSSKEVPLLELNITDCVIWWRYFLLEWSQQFSQVLI